MSVRERISVDVENIGTSWVSVKVKEKPARYRIWRARVNLKTGTATEVALRVSEHSNGDEENIVLEYAPTSGYIDFEEPGWLFISKENVQNLRGTTTIALKADTTGNAFSVELDIEPIM